VLRFILLTLLFILVARFIWRLAEGIVTAARGTQPGHRSDSAQAVKLVRDPVCGTHVSPRAALSITSGGDTHYFCSEQCRVEFKKRS
jgi:YHS domain-containing protein